MRLKKKKEKGERKNSQEKRANKRFGSVENKRQLALVNTLEGRGGVRAAGKVPCLPESIQIWSQKLLKVLAKRSFPLPAKWQFELSPSSLFLLPFVSFCFYLITCQADIAVWFDFATPPKGGSLCACCSTWARKRAHTWGREKQQKKTNFKLCSKSVDDLDTL